MSKHAFFTDDPELAEAIKDVIREHGGTLTSRPRSPLGTYSYRAERDPERERRRVAAARDHFGIDPFTMRTDA